MYIKLNDLPFHHTQIVNFAENGMVIGTELLAVSRYIENLNELVARLGAAASIDARIFPPYKTP